MPRKTASNRTSKATSRNVASDVDTKEEEERKILKNYLLDLKNVELTDKQKELFKLMSDDENKIIIVTGPAGTAKTFSTCYYIIHSIASAKYKKVALTKPLEESGEKLGFLPGDKEDKTAPYFESYEMNMKQMIAPNKVQGMFDKKFLEYRPLAYMRGASFPKMLLVGDEFQNADLRQIMLFVTRMGRGSKVILLGDVTQTDVKKNMSGLKRFQDMTNGTKGVINFQFTREDIMRDEILITITDLYEKYKEEHPELQNKYGA